jgi:hypothetical protein
LSVAVVLPTGFAALVVGSGGPVVLRVRSKPSEVPEEFVANNLKW